MEVSDEHRAAALGTKARRRAAHEQRLAERQQQAAKTFEGTQLVGYFSTTSFRFDSSGMMIIQLAVMAEFRDECLKLLDSEGMPLSIDFQRWAPYVRALEDNG